MSVTPTPTQPPVPVTILFEQSELQTLLNFLQTVDLDRAKDLIAGGNSYGVAVALVNLVAMINKSLQANNAVNTNPPVDPVVPPNVDGKVTPLPTRN